MLIMRLLWRLTAMGDDELQFFILALFLLAFDLSDEKFDEFMQKLSENNEN